LESIRDHILHGATGNRIDVAEGWVCLNTRGRSLFRDVRSLDRPVQELTVLPVPGRASALHRCFATRFVPLAEARIEFCSPTRQVFDADRLGPAPAVRRREDGDRFEPLGMEGTCKVKDYFIDRGVPAADRDDVPLLLAGQRIAWIVGHGMGRFAAITKATQRVVEVTVEPATE
jgi:tRNA(Ile)-lysidine synthase